MMQYFEVTCLQFEFQLPNQIDFPANFVVETVISQTMFCRTAPCFWMSNQSVSSFRILKQLTLTKRMNVFVRNTETGPTFTMYVTTYIVMVDTINLVIEFDL